MNGHQSMVKRSLLTFCRWLVVLTVLAWGVSFFCAKILHLGYPFNTPLFNPASRFSDLTDLYVKIKHLNLGAEMLGTGLPIVNYPAPALYVYAFFIDLFPNPVLALITVLVLGAVGALTALRSMLTGCGVDGRTINITLAITAACSYPLLFDLDRANLEGAVWILVFLGLVFFLRGSYLLSAIWYAAAVCIKPLPALFFFLFLTRRKYKEILAAVAIAGLTNLIALKTVGPTIPAALASLRPGLQKYFDDYVIAFQHREIGYDHSIFSCFKQLNGVVLGWHRGAGPQSTLLGAYLVWAPIAGLILIACGFHFWRKPLLNQLFAIVLLMLLLPPVSSDYTLLNLYLPWGVFLVFLVREVGSRNMTFSYGKSLLVLIPCAILFTPQSYLTLEQGGFGGQLKAVVLSTLLVVVAFVDMPISSLDEFDMAKLTSSPPPRKL